MMKKAKPKPSKASVASFLDSLDDEPASTAPVSRPAPRKKSSKQEWLDEQKAYIEAAPVDPKAFEALKPTPKPEHVTAKGTVIIPFVPLPQRSPPKTAPGTFKRGDVCFYRETRYFIEYAPSDWSQGHYARISSAIVHPDIDRLPSKDRETFCVHVDLLRQAPQPKSLFGKLPTVASAARAERSAAGLRDVGDKTANLLRGAKGSEDLYRIGAKILGCSAAELEGKYGHLNPGQIRMNIGNRIRAKLKKEYKHVVAA